MSSPAGWWVRLTGSVVLRTALYYAAVLSAGWLARGVLPAVAPRAVLVLQAMIAALALALPVAWIYTLTRAKRGYQQSVVQLLVLLPMVVAGIVVLVKDSLPLAFALAGIVAAVRFRNSLDDSKDAVYVFLTTGIGLAAAVDLSVAAAASILFNVVVLVFWYSDFGHAPQRLGGAVGARRLEQARATMTRTGTFVSRVDETLLREMTADQLRALSERAARRAHEHDPDATAEQREGRLRVRTFDGARSRQRVEPLLGTFAKRWSYDGTTSDRDGTEIVEYALLLRKSAIPDELLRGVRDAGAPDVIGAELQ